MDKKKVALALVSLLCVSGSVFAASYGDDNSVRSALMKTDNPYSPYYGKSVGSSSNNSLKAMLAEKKAARTASAGKGKAVNKENSNKNVNVQKKEKPFAGVQSLPPVQRRVLADEGRFSDPENPTGYYLDGDKIAYPEQTRIIKHKQGKPVKIFMQAKRITDIFLKSDEHIEKIVINEPFGLNIKKTYEAGRYSRWHVSIVPVDNNPGTEMYIRTDKRSYHFYLEPTSNGNGYVPFVRFAYLEDRSVKPAEKQNVKPQKEKPVAENKQVKAVDKKTVEEKPVSVPKPVSNVGVGSKSAGGTSEGIQLYWSN